MGFLKTALKALMTPTASERAAYAARKAGPTQRTETYVGSRGDAEKKFRKHAAQLAEQGWVVDSQSSHNQGIGGMRAFLTVVYKRAASSA